MGRKAARRGPAGGLREPCPCGSGRRYKSCHGRGTPAAGRPVARPFAGLPGECDWVALRELVPAATAALRLAPGPAHSSGRPVLLATLLPLGRAGLLSEDGRAVVSVQAPAGSGDVSRDIAGALLRCLDLPAGAAVAATDPPGDAPRLQEILDLGAAFDVSVHPGFDFWLEHAGTGPDVRASAERATAAVLPTQRLSSVEAAYWCELNGRRHLRWVLPYDEEPLLDAMARLHAGGADGMGPGSRLLGTFRAHGLVIPVWELADGTPAEAVEAPATRYAELLAEALGAATPLTSEQRQARAGLVSRQLTLR